MASKFEKELSKQFNLYKICRDTICINYSLKCKIRAELLRILNTHYAIDMEFSRHIYSFVNQNELIVLFVDQDGFIKINIYICFEEYSIHKQICSNEEDNLLINIYANDRSHDHNFYVCIKTLNNEMAIEIKDQQTEWIILPHNISEYLFNKDNGEQMGTFVFSKDNDTEMTEFYIATSLLTHKFSQIGSNEKIIKQIVEILISYYPDITENIFTTKCICATFENIYDYIKKLIGLITLYNFDFVD